MKKNSALPLLAMLALLSGLAACAPGREAFRHAQELKLQGDYDGAVVESMAAVDHAPKRQEYRMQLDKALGEAAWEHLKRGRQRMQDGERAAAADEFRKALEYDKTLQVAEVELKEAERLLRGERLTTQADEFIRTRRLQQARANLDEALLIEPENATARAMLEKLKNGPRTIVDGVELDMTSTKPITLKFKDTDIKDAFSILSKLTGVNFILDAEIKRQTFSFVLTEVSFPQALELILQMNKLGKKVLNPRTIIIYSRSKDSDKLFGDQIIQTFYLSNIDSKKAVNLLRTMLQLRRVYVHEELNAIVVRDTPDVIKLVGQMLEAADRADAEVTFDLELIEVNHSDQLKFGPNTGTSVSFGLSKAGSGTIVGGGLESGGDTAKLITGLSNLQTFYTLPTMTFDFLKTRSDAEVLANPKIRVKNREKAKVHIGSKEPVITVTQNNDIITDNVTYVDVGVKLDVEPIIQLDNTVVTKLSLEVSSVSGRQTTGNGTQVLTLTTTNAQSSLTLRDGERTIIGGLIRDEDTKSRTGIAFLSDLPLLGPLLTSHSNNKAKREILLSITPHIVQNIVVPDARVGSIWSGGEDDLKAGPTFGAFTSYEPEPETPAAMPEAAVPVPGSQPPAPASDGAIPVEVLPPAPAGGEAALPGAPDGGGVPEAAAIPAAPENMELLSPPAEPPRGDGQLLVAGPEGVAVGEEFTVDVLGTGLKGVYTAPLFVTYDAERLEVVKVEEGDFLKQGEAATTFSTNPGPVPGELIVGYRQGRDARGASGDGILFRLVLRAKAAGTAQIGLDRLNLRNADGERLNVSVNPLSVSIR